MGRTVGAMFAVAEDEINRIGFNWSLQAEADEKNGELVPGLTNGMWKAKQCGEGGVVILQVVTKANPLENLS